MLSFLRKYKKSIIITLAVIGVLGAAYFLAGKPSPNPTVQVITASSDTAVTSVYSQEETPESRISSADSEETVSSAAPPVSSALTESAVSSAVSVPAVFSSVPVSEEEQEQTDAEMSQESSAVTETASPEPAGSTAELSADVSDEYSVLIPQDESSIVPVSVQSSESPDIPSEESSAAEVSESSDAPEAHRCTITIVCGTLIGRTEELPKNKRSLVPADGVLLTPCTMTIEEGESVFEVTKRTCQMYRIPFEFTLTPIYNTAYIEGIGSLYEFDCGSGSGWVYSVNDLLPGVGCSDYEVHNGDHIVWHYTCALGSDIVVGGGSQMEN